MSDRVLIPKAPTSETGVDPSPAWGREVWGYLFLRCKCGSVLSVRSHTIDANGDVMPSLWHDTPECGWHVYGTFEGWASDPDGASYVKGSPKNEQ